MNRVNMIMYNRVRQLLGKTFVAHNLRIALDTGKFLDIESADTLPNLGDRVLIEGERPVDGPYKAAETKVTYHIRDGKIEGIEQPELIIASAAKGATVNALQRLEQHYANEFKAMQKELTKVSRKVDKLRTPVAMFGNSLPAIRNEIAALKPSQAR